MSQSKRKQLGTRIQDQGALENLGYSVSAGGFKNVAIGPHLLPLQTDATTYTTNASTAVPLPQPGKMLAVYNNAGAVGSVTVSLLQVSSLAAGVTDSAGNVGIACPPNAWTYISCGDAIWVISSASTLLVYLIDDDTYLGQ